ncbi:MAG TPA: hypothetical protein VGK25_14200 [Ignavibacteria bacterium]
MKHLKRASLVLPLFFLISVFMTGCDENGGITIPSGVTEITVSTKSNDNLGNPPAAVVITEVKALISEVEFEQESNQNNQVIKMSPFVVFFNTDGTLREMTTSYIIKDFYTKVKFQIHKPEDNETPPDPEFVNGTQRYSFIIKGTYNGSAFTYRSRKTANIVINFGETININLKKMNITIAFNKLGWFKNGSVDLNPSDPQNENMIDDNIKNSFRSAFKDDDKNGNPDN